MIFKTLCLYGIKQKVSFTIKFIVSFDITTVIIYVLLEMEGKYAALDTGGTQLLTYVMVGIADQTANVKELQSPSDSLYLTFFLRCFLVYTRAEYTSCFIHLPIFILA